MKVLITGSAGFIGSHLAERMQCRGDCVIGVDCLSDYYSVDQKMSNAEGVKTTHFIDIASPDHCWEFEDLVESDSPDAIVHLAATPGVRYSVGRADEYVQNNVVASVNALEAARRHGVKHVVFASTSSVYGNAESPFVEDMPCDRPLAPYPASKRMVELMGHAYHVNHGLNFTALRFFSVYGPRARPDMMPFMTVDAIAKGKPITLFNEGRMWRDWTHVDDIVSGIVAAVDRPVGYEVFNLGNGSPVRMDRFVDYIEAEMGRSVEIILKDAPASEPVRTCADISKARGMLDYNPVVALESGVKSLCEWYKNIQLSSTS